MTAPKSPETLPLSEQPVDLVQQLLQEQYAAWQRGDLVSVETYRDREHLQEDADALLDLICGEVVLRNGREGRRSRQEYLQEYLTRFPDLAAQLPMHFEVL